MQTRMFDYLTSRQLPTGRRIFVLRAIKKVAEGFGDAEIADECETAIEFNGKTWRLEVTYERAKTHQSDARGDARSIDRMIDRTFSGMHAVAEGQTFGSTDKARKAGEFLVEVFPSGLAGLIQMPFEEQLNAELDLLERFDTDLADHVDVLGLDGHVDLLGKWVPQFRAELEKESGQNVTYAEIKDARRDGLDRFADVIFAVLSANKSSDPAAAQRREQYMAEYHRQNQIVAEAYKRDEPVEDIDPDTDEPVSEDEADEDVVEPVT